MRLFWHRRDRRLHDNRGLAAAASDDTVLPVAVRDDAVGPPADSRARAYRAATDAALREAYRERGSDLRVRSGDPAAVLPALADECGADAVHWNVAYGRERRERAERVADACASAGLDVAAHTDAVLVAPETLGDDYRSHRAFLDDWEAVEKPEPAPTPDADALAAVTDDAALPAATADIDLPGAGHDAARKRLDGFVDAGIETYADTRDDLAAAVERPREAVSRLSPFLAAGALGIREAWAAAGAALDDAAGDAARNVEKYRYELTWRERHFHLLAANPDLRRETYRSFETPVAWRDDDEAFAAWRAGETGYPLVDAGMRQLEREGYVHNRPRQVVASFLTKHLLHDWRDGERHFARRLVDYDPASNAAMWQWCASTGTDTVDVRIFDPVAQMDKYDADAAFVSEYVPELRGVPARKVVEWPTLDAAERHDLAPAYADPIVERDAAYERAERAFETALGKR
ncbi:deoxyribodipyrimidine photo-lyase [Halarchaeum rubridurum]|uniref:Deoxyribodipyrimidine photo-lyase n=1 Tax=Halarchaeum rubridurum TaxID=489911 RepID=A0A830FWW9_9EURY|nr:deoxyribodipyrimidine photo-lyase [Halarchaeum rubridurum]MBP1953851.1 deoxyribodipyrimidine photo-lyase [Halarchaeum rubridurum]GGM55284.1 deoxyribodipyrimidine photo-lyase [Halarchaeum rubridurum]